MNDPMVILATIDLAIPALAAVACAAFAFAVGVWLGRTGRAS